MKYNPVKHHRRSIRLPEYDYSGSGSYFLTICAYQRQCLFGDVINGAMQLNDFGAIVAEEWQRSAIIRSNLELDAWVVMPNHFHGIVTINNPVGAQRVAPLPICNQHANKLHRQPQSLGSFVAGFKRSTTKRINEIKETPGVPVWQRNYYEHIIRNEETWHRLRQYIANNPISLCQIPSDVYRANLTSSYL
jgi:REP element-mobilizing transposase RayT